MWVSLRRQRERNQLKTLMIVEDITENLYAFFQEFILGFLGDFFGVKKELFFFFRDFGMF